MRQYIKYFLTFLVLFWLFGFWYILVFSNKNTNDININSNSNNDNNNNDAENEDKSKLMNRIRLVEKKLLNLEKQNSENEKLIAKLK